MDGNQGKGNQPVDDRIADAEQPFSVEEYDHGCPSCGAGKTYVVVYPSGMAGSVTYDDKDEAEEMAEHLTEAYNLGRGLDKTHAKR